MGNSDLDEPLQQMKHIFDEQGGVDQQFPIKTEESVLFLTCAYIGEWMNAAIEHPRSYATVQSDDLQEWIDVLVLHSKVAIRKVDLQLKWWKSFNDPILVFEKDTMKPFAAIPARGNVKGYLFDVAKGERRALDAATVQILQTNAYVFYETLPEQISNIQELFAFGMRAINDKLWFLLAILGLLGVVRLFFPIANQVMFDAIIPVGNVSLFWQLAFALFVVLLVEFALTISRGYAILRLQVLWENKVQIGFWDRIMSLSLVAFRQFTGSDLLERMVLLERIRPFVSAQVLYTLCEAPFALCFALLMVYYSVKLALIAFFLLVVFVSVTLRLRKKIFPLSAESSDAQIALRDFVTQIVKGADIIRVANAENRAFSQWASRFTLLEKLKLIIRQKEKYCLLIQSIYVTATLAVIYGWIAFFFHENGMLPFSLTMGTFIGFQTAFFLLAGAINSLLDFYPSYLQIVRQCQRTDVLLAYPTEQVERKHSEEKFKGEIIVDNLCFQYSSNSKPTLSQISFKCEPGQFIGITGRSGSGKSTILRCLMGFETPESGDIYYDGHSLKDLDIHSIRRRIGAVMQESHIFSGNIKSNLLLGRYASRQTIDRALELSCFDEVLHRLPSGLKSYISKGYNNVYSGGEMQRLLIARALISDIDILLLDEATSALDALTQDRVMKNLATLNITRIVVAHRLETIQKADHILIIKDGKIAQRGTFKELELNQGFAHE